jgi:hypothetical protein
MIRSGVRSSIDPRYSRGGDSGGRYSLVARAPGFELVTPWGDRPVRPGARSVMTRQRCLFLFQTSLQVDL